MHIPKYPKLLQDTKKSGKNTEAHRPNTLQKTQYCGEVCSSEKIAEFFILRQQGKKVLVF